MQSVPRGLAAKFATRIAVVAGLALCAAGIGLRAQDSGGGVEVLQVRPNFYMIAGAGANIGVQIGADGVVLVNTGTREASAEVLAAIRKLTEQPIRYVINTSADADVVGGNRPLSSPGHVRLRALRSAGPITEHRSRRRRLMCARERPQADARRRRSRRSPASSGRPKPSSSAGGDLYFNDEGIEILHLPAAHTDGDSVVFFRRSDVVVAGHVLDDTRFPVIDLARGGSIQGEIDALNRLIELAIPPGPVRRRAERRESPRRRCREAPRCCRGVAGSTVSSTS